MRSYIIHLSIWNISALFHSSSNVGLFNFCTKKHEHVCTTFTAVVEESVVVRKVVEQVVEEESSRKSN